MSERLVRVVSPRFVAGLILQHDICIRAAPILHRLMVAQTAETIARIIAARGWHTDNPEESC